MSETHSSSVNLTEANLGESNLYGTSSKCTNLAEANVCGPDLMFALII
ncbi:MAG: hypothetical protein JJP05_00780 [cyanobacterium endosymbiont of Rhopalodia gibba]